MGLARRLAISFVIGAIALALSFALIFGGGLAWEVSRYPHDGQAGMGPFFIGILLAPAMGAIASAITFLKLRL